MSQLACEHCKVRKQLYVIWPGLIDCDREPVSLTPFSSINDWSLDTGGSAGKFRGRPFFRGGPNLRKANIFNNLVLSFSHSLILRKVYAAGRFFF